MLNGLRQALGSVPANLYSDGNDTDLALLLALPRVVRPAKAPSVTDLLGLAHASSVISSLSGFSYVGGAFLADSPRICLSGQRVTRVLARGGTEPDSELACESWGELAASKVQGDPRTSDASRSDRQPHAR